MLYYIERFKSDKNLNEPSHWCISASLARGQNSEMSSKSFVSSSLGHNSYRKPFAKQNHKKH